MTFGDVVICCSENAEFVANWARLRGIRLAHHPIERMIDQATGNDREIALTFLADVYDLVWCRLPASDRS